MLYFLNTTTAQYDDPKWQFGREAGFAWVGFSRQGLNISSFNKITQSTKGLGWKGVRVIGSV